MIPEYKFAFISCCLIIALLSSSRCVCKKDWGLLSGGLGFTVLSDYFLVIQQEHLIGVAAFCFVHVCYILRAVEFNKRTLSLLYAFGFLWAIVFILEVVIAMAVIYACLFAVNIYVNAKTRRYKLNYFLVMTGLVLFALCDMNVMLFNLPQYFGTAKIFPNAFLLIWVFYLPSQLLLSLSAISFKRPVFIKQEI